MKTPIPLPGKREVRNIWAWARSLAPSQRYDGAADSDPHDAELLVLPSQRSLSSVSETTTKERAVQDPTLVTPMLGEAKETTDEHSGISAHVLENTSLNKSKASWIKGVYLCGYATAGLLLSNVIFVSVTAGLSSKFPGTGGSSNSKVIYNGSCDVADRWNRGLHIIINIISTCILAMSNYCMQTLVAPTRDEINIAHAKRRWLDVGGSSFRNLFVIPYTRLGLWIVLLLTATPFHLLYNSLVFKSLNYNPHWSFAAPHDFTPEDVRNLTTPALQDCFRTTYIEYPPLESYEKFDWNQQILQIEGSKSKKISAEECFEKIDPPNSKFAYEGIILLTSNRSMSDSGNESVLGFSSWSSPGEAWAGPFVNSNPKTIQDHECISPDILHYRAYQENKIMHVTECLAFEGKQICELLYNPIIAVIVIVATFVKVIAIFLAAHIHKSRSTPLLTSGDAIASFLEDPDETTKGMCWASLNNFKKKNWITCPKGQEPQRHTVRYQRLTRPQQWRKASNPIHWFVTVLIVLLCVVATTLLYPFFVVGSGSALGNDELTWQAIWDIDSIARENARGTASDSVRKYSELQSVVTVNSAQLVVTLCYYFYNSLLTRMLLSAEYSSYGVDRKPLRVTWPVEGSKQRSTYWLSIPYQYGLPAMALFTILHWLVSQGIYFLMVIPYAADGNPMYAEKKSTPTYSYMPLICAGSLLGLLGIMIVGVSFRRLKSEIPLAGTCSAAISAACHPPENVCTNTVAHGELMWGETDLPWALRSGADDDDDDDDESDEAKGHCSFTPSEAMQPSLDKLYA